EPKAVSGVRAVAVIDGEHYPPVVCDALAELPYDFVAAVLVGGTEKLRGGERRAPAGRRGRSVRRAGARAGAAPRARIAGAGRRRPLRRRRLPLRAAGVRAVR